VCRCTADRSGGTPNSAGTSRQASAFSGRAESGSPGVGLGTLQNSSLTNLLPSILPRESRCRALSGGLRARIFSLAEELRSDLLCTGIGDDPNSLLLPPSSLPGGSRSIQRGNRHDQGCPGSRIFWVLPVKAWREDSRWGAGFADCIEHAVGRPCFSARKPSSRFSSDSRSNELDESSRASLRLGVDAGRTRPGVSAGLTLGDDAASAQSQARSKPVLVFGNTQN
jgi:hypothetical protein